MDEISYLRNRLEVKENEENRFQKYLLSLGIDKCIEMYEDITELIEFDQINFSIFEQFMIYDQKLSCILFSMLKNQENYVKAFLSNYFNNYRVQIEEREGGGAKTKYYFKIPVGKNEFLDIRTFSYEYGPVDYYDAIKTLDFGDINLIMSHLPTNIVEKFSDNPNIIFDLDNTRKLRNYVYHHNILFSLGKETLTKLIKIILKNIPDEKIKELYIKEINALKYNEDNTKIDERLTINL